MRNIISDFKTFVIRVVRVLQKRFSANKNRLIIPRLINKFSHLHVIFGYFLNNNEGVEKGCLVHWELMG